MFGVDLALARQPQGQASWRRNDSRPGRSAPSMRTPASCENPGFASPAELRFDIGWVRKRHGGYPFPRIA